MMVNQKLSFEMVSMKFSHPFLVLTLALFISLSSVAFAQTEKQPEIPAFIKGLEEKGATVKYLGSDLGVNGWLIIADGAAEYVYTTPDGKANIAGFLIDEEGTVVSQAQMATFMEENKEIMGSFSAQKDAQKVDVSSETKANSDKAQKLFEDIEKTNWVVLGQPNAPIIYTIIDPECPHCHAMIDDLNRGEAFENGSLQMRAVPVGLISKTSLYRAENLLRSGTASADLMELAKVDGKQVSDAEPDSLELVKKNMAFLQEWGLDVTPFTIYKDQSGKIKVVRGVPDDMQALINDTAFIN
tara:strand:- start:1040 stop:1936 length:897 start_codon:yes stop_codon:yes gene_type:complete